MKEQVIIVAGGIGSRMRSDIPKQFLLVEGKSLIEYTIEQFLNYNPKIKIVVVVAEEWMSILKQLLQKNIQYASIKITAGGKERYHSVKNGLAVVDKGLSLIAVHDAARPMVSAETIRKTFASAKEKGTGIPVVSLKESIRFRSSTGNKSLDRKEYCIVQTPQVFLSDILIKSYELPFSEKWTDDASLVEASGVEINLVDGNEENIKITSPIDLLVFKEFLTV